MLRKQEIINLASDELIAVQDFPEKTTTYNIDAYDIWAGVEVSSFELIPKGLEAFKIPEGKYAVFVHKGMNAKETYQKIMTKWLPASGYEIDDRPHFQVMGEKYKNGSPDSEEDFYIPVKLKSEF